VDHQRDNERSGLRASVEASEILARLEKALEHSAVADELLDLVGARLTGLGTATWGQLYESFTAYLGVGHDKNSEEPPDLILRWARAEPDERQDLEDALVGRPRAAAFIRRVVAIYGPEIRDAFAIWREDPHTWRGIRPRILRDLRTGTPVIEIVVTKMNGEELYLIGTSSGVLDLVRSLLQILQLIPSPRKFDSQSVADFLREAGEFSAGLAVSSGDGDEGDAREPSPE
jgi:hypothetical protein